MTLVLGAWLLGAATAPDPYEATRARPLFSPTRRPLPPAIAPPSLVVAPVVQANAPPPPVSLSGVILGPGTSVALLTRPGSAEATRVALGARIDGWRVSEIRPRAVVLTLDDRSVTVTLPGSDR